MKNQLALAICLALTTGAVTAGMQGQGAAPDAKKPEYKEANPGPYHTRGDDTKSAKGSPGTEKDLLPKSKKARGQSYQKSPGRTPGGQL